VLQGGTEKIAARGGERVGGHPRKAAYALGGKPWKKGSYSPSKFNRSLKRTCPWRDIGKPGKSSEKLFKSNFLPQKELLKGNAGERGRFFGGKVVLGGGKNGLHLEETLFS